MRRRLRTCGVVGWVLGVATSALAITPPPQIINRWIGQLDSADPIVRSTFTEALVQFGDASARPAVIRALPTASPEAAVRLRAVLLRTVHWDARNGAAANPAVEAAFAGYASLSAEERCARIEGLQGPGVSDALIRVLTADPCPAVRWSAADVLRKRFDDDHHSGPPDRATDGQLLAARVLLLADRPASSPADPSAFPPPAANGPLLAAAAWAVHAIDPARADGLFARALAIEADAPSAVRGQADFAYLWTADRATEREDYAATADQLRQLAARTAYSAAEVPDGVAELLALHADHGPLPGFADDLRLYRPYLARPELLYGLGRLAGRHGGPISGPVVQAIVDAAALALGGTSSDDHCRTSMAVLRHGWADAAERELLACVWTGGGGSVEVELGLYEAAADRDDDAAAGRHLDAALRLAGGGGGAPRFRTNRYGQSLPWTEAYDWATVHWHLLRAAVTAGDREAAQAQAQQLLDLDADGGVLDHDPGMAADVVPVLVDAGRPAEADRCFTAAYKKLAELVATDAGEAMPKNNLAWLCARSDRHMDEADRLSAEAVRLAPADAACLDTRAEVLARTGRPREAADLESRALSFKPDDVYMQRQLERFEAAARVR